MTKDEMIALARQTAKDHGLDDVLVCAIVEQESYPPWNPWSLRAEPAFDAKYVQPLHKTPTEEWARSMSWGLMQLMGESARERGYTGDLPALCDPATGLLWGCKHFVFKMAQAGGDKYRALLLWNGGGDPTYPQKVINRMPHYTDTPAMGVDNASDN